MKQRKKMKEMALVISLIMSALTMGSIFAVDSPRAMALDSRIRTIPYEENNVTNLTCSTFVTTQIIFSKDQRIADIQGGDADAWSIYVPKLSQLQYMLNIKPTIVGSSSDLLITTINSSGKTFFYRFHIVSVNKKNAPLSHITYALQFVYPKQARAKLLAALDNKREEKRSIVNAAKNPKDYNWNYSFNGARAIMPLHVFDDGKFTYMQLRKNQDVPAIFAVNNPAGKEAVVNFRKVGRYLVIQTVSPQFTLREGKYLVASIFNNRLISKIEHSS